jgi:dihydrofolate reductase
MGRLIISNQMTLDGVIDPMADGGWYRPGGEHAARGLQQVRAADAMLLGWRTFEGLAGFWPTQQDEWADVLNPMPKHVLSRSQHEGLPWNGSMVEGGIEGVGELKQRLDGDLLSVGCGELAYELAVRGLADELRFWVHPIALGDGARPFHGRGRVDLQLAAEERFDEGVVLLTYRPAG